MSAARQVFSDALLLGVGMLVAVLGFGALSRVFDRPEPTAAEQARQEQAAVHGLVQLEVLNGAGEDGIAAQTKTYLRGLGGFDVMDTRNAPRRDSTVVIDRVGNIEEARRVARALGLEAARVQSDPRPSLLVDVSVILGADYRRLAPFRSYP